MVCAITMTLNAATLQTPQDRLVQEASTQSTSINSSALTSHLDALALDTFVQPEATNYFQVSKELSL